MRQEILEILTELRPDVEFENEKKLIDDGILLISCRWWES